MGQGQRKDDRPQEVKEAEEKGGGTSMVLRSEEKEEIQSIKYSIGC